jgi:hypothetical protein
MKAMLAVSIMLLAAGCVRANVERLDQAPRPERSPDDIQLLVEKPDQPYTVIAVVEAKADAVFKDFDDLRSKMLEEAAKLGGDAVILGAEDSESTFMITATGQIHSDRKKLRGEVIVYRQP